MIKVAYKARLETTLETGHQQDNRQNLMGSIDYIVDEY